MCIVVWCCGFLGFCGLGLVDCFGGRLVGGVVSETCFSTGCVICVSVWVVGEGCCVCRCLGFCVWVWAYLCFDLLEFALWWFVGDGLCVLGYVICWFW